MKPIGLKIRSVFGIMCSGENIGEQILEKSDMNTALDRRLWLAFHWGVRDSIFVLSTRLELLSKFELPEMKLR